MADARRACGLTQRRVKKPAVEGNGGSGGGEVNLGHRGDRGMCHRGQWKLPCDTIERSCLLSLARAVEEALSGTRCPQIPV